MQRLLWFVLVTALAPSVAAELPRRAGAPLESHPGIALEYGQLKVEGARLRTIFTKPASRTGRVPALLFVHWLSCDSVEVPDTAQDGWNRMLRGVIRDSGLAVMRTEKAGVGDSEGDCATLDYQTELAHHRAAFAALRERADVDPARILVFGASMGATHAPLVAAGQRVAGVMTWGGGARSWLERQLAFDRRALELGGTPAAELNPKLLRLARFESEYLLRQRTPAQIAAADAELGKVWGEIVGTGGTDKTSQYGRPIAFHHQAQAQNWPAAWAKVDAPVLALLGELDWFEQAGSGQLIADVVNARRPGSAQFRLLPGLDHHFMRYPDAVAAFKEQGGVADAKAALDVMLPWLKKVTQR